MFFCCSNFINSQNTADFFIEKTFQVPQYLLNNPEKLAVELAKNQDVLEEKEAVEMYKNSFYILNERVNTGELYFSNELTDYLTKIVVELLVSEGSLKGKIRVFLTRSTQPNAFCLPDGTILVNVGLMNVLENESQLAGILAHEITHYKKNHALIQRKKNKDLKEKKYNNTSSEGVLFKMLSYSRENEFESDAGALNIIGSTKFNAFEYPKALKLISREEKDSLKGTLSEFFNTDVFVLDTALVSKKNVKKELTRSVSKSRSLLKMGDVEYETHPDAEKRILAAKEILASVEYKAPADLANNEFAQLKRKASFETVENAYLEGEYIESLLLALKLKEQYPKSESAEVMVVKNIYWLSRLKENGIMTDFLAKVEVNKTADIARLKVFFDKTKAADLGKFLFTYIKKQLERFPENESIAFYVAASAELHLGKDAALVFYKKYNMKFPNGNYSAFIKNKID